MFIEKQNACPCAYCEYFKAVEYNKEGITIQKGICRKHDQLRELNDKLCKDFILRSGVYTNKWYPIKNED